ncbi:hypothetical protein ACFLVX_05275, partial [Chloroflexota bacterium]
MARIDSQLLARQLEEILSSYSQLLAQSQDDDLFDLAGSDIHRIITQSRAAIIRIAGVTSPYTQQVSDILARSLW